MTKRQRPFLTKHNAASPSEFLYYASGMPMKYLTRVLQRHERTVKAWMAGKAVIPPWAVAVLRLRHLEHEMTQDQMGLRAIQREQQARERQPVIQRRPATNDEQYAVQLRLDIV
ncbi:hypothetical protein FAZ69_18315 [Trinickia terrae]|uniref:Uncharacterized protein n=1 Tax=Trinickia terrae TaxID=2571161 RepID=A0A4U1I281_9BURK|nr:hypothetical protein [Trinickia terrae]TKC87286.1 hypothetical protein FAZ69_18315 [Trinickia terrae]